MNIKITPGQKLLIQCILLIWAPSGAFADGNTDELLTLTEEERIALDLDPVTKNFVVSSEGFEEQANWQRLGVDCHCMNSALFPMRK